MRGGRKSTRGIPQPGVISPLLANLYINRFLNYWRIKGRGEAFRAQVTSCTDVYQGKEYKLLLTSLCRPSF